MYHLPELALAALACRPRAASRETERSETERCERLGRTGGLSEAAPCANVRDAVSAGAAVQGTPALPLHKRSGDGRRVGRQRC